MQGTARVVVLDRVTGATFTEDIGDENPVALYIPGRHAHGFEALTDLLFVYHVTEEYDPADPDEHGHPLGRPSGEGAMEHGDPDALRPGPAGLSPDRRRVLITGAGGQLGVALAAAFAADDVDALTRDGLGRALPGARRRCSRAGPRPARGGLDERRRRRGRSPGCGRGERRRHGARGRARRADRRVLHRLRLRRPQGRAVPRVRQPEPAVGVRDDEAPRRGRGRRARLGDQELVALRPHRSQLRPHDAPARGRAGRGGGRRRPARLPDLRRAPRRCDARARRRRAALRRLAPRGGGDCTWADFAEAIFEEAGLDCRVRRITTAEFGARAPRPPRVDPAQREGRSRASALARRPRRVPRRDRVHRHDPRNPRRSTNRLRYRSGRRTRGVRNRGWRRTAGTLLRCACSSPEGPASSAPTSCAGSPDGGTRSSSSTS